MPDDIEMPEDAEQSQQQADGEPQDETPEDETPDGNEAPAEPEDEPATEAPPAPSYLKEMAKRAWRRTAGQLVEMGVLTEADLVALEAYCTLDAHYRDAESHLKASMLVTGANGQKILSPYHRVSRECLKEMKAWMLEFGLTPSSRSRVRVKQPTADEGGETEDWFNDHKN